MFLFFYCCYLEMNVLCMVLALYTHFLTWFLFAHHMLDEMPKWIFVLDNHIEFDSSIIWFEFKKIDFFLV